MSTKVSKIAQCNTECWSGYCVFVCWQGMHAVQSVGSNVAAKAIMPKNAQVPQGCARQVC
jgi:hypothetical protein